MTRQTIVLLPVAEARPPGEAKVWLSDGFRMIKMRLAQWSTYAVLTVFALVFTVFFGGMLADFVEQSVGEGSATLTLFFKLALVNMVTVATHCGMFTGMTRVTQGGAVRIQDMLWFFKAPQRRHLLALVALLTVCNLLYVVVEESMFAEQILLIPDINGPYVVDGKAFRLNEELLLRQGGVFMVYTLLLRVLTWSVLPLMTLFADVSLLQALRYNFDGLKKNLLPLLYLLALISLIYMGIGFVAGLLASLMPLLALPFMALLAVWMLPLNNAWTYAAFRHIYTDW